MQFYLAATEASSGLMVASEQQVVLHQLKKIIFEMTYSWLEVPNFVHNLHMSQTNIQTP